MKVELEMQHSEVRVFLPVETNEAGKIVKGQWKGDDTGKCLRAETYL